MLWVIATVIYYEKAVGLSTGRLQQWPSNIQSMRHDGTPLINEISGGYSTGDRSLL